MKAIRLQVESLEIETFDPGTTEDGSETVVQRNIPPNPSELTACDCGLWTLSPYLASCVDYGCGYP